MGREKGRKGEREEVSTSGYSIFVDVVSFVINVYNFIPDYHGNKKHKFNEGGMQQLYTDNAWCLK